LKIENNRFNKLNSANYWKNCRSLILKNEFPQKLSLLLIIIEKDLQTTKSIDIKGKFICFKFMSYLYMTKLFERFNSLNATTVDRKGNFDNKKKM